MLSRMHAQAVAHASTTETFGSTGSVTSDQETFNRSPSPSFSAPPLSLLPSQTNIIHDDHSPPIAPNPAASLPLSPYRANATPRASSLLSPAIANCAPNGQENYPALSELSDLDTETLVRARKGKKRAITKGKKQAVPANSDDERGDEPRSSTRRQVSRKGRK